jgi:hypothetical protein
LSNLLASRLHCPQSDLSPFVRQRSVDLHGHRKVFFQLDGEKFSAIPSRQTHSAMFSIWWSGNLSGRMGYIELLK